MGELSYSLVDYFIEASEDFLAILLFDVCGMIDEICQIDKQILHKSCNIFLVYFLNIEALII